MKRPFILILLLTLSLVACNRQQAVNDCDYGVIVVGGGPAGIGAALAAAM